MDEATYQAERNMRDLVNWCGIFALFVWKSAGLKLPYPSWHPQKTFSTSFGKAGNITAVRAKDIQKGDIGIIEPNRRNHHFIVTEVAGNMIHSIDGNAGKYHSIVQNTYQISNPNSSSFGPHIIAAISGVHGAEIAYFVAPNWSAVMGKK
jgi:hypothetical protein